MPLVGFRVLRIQQRGWARLVSRELRSQAAPDTVFPQWKNYLAQRRGQEAEVAPQKFLGSMATVWFSRCLGRAAGSAAQGGKLDPQVQKGEAGF